MKKTLFTISALALCGAAFADTYNASDYEGRYFNSSEAYEQGSDVVFNVDKTTTLDGFMANGASSMTLNFVGASTFSASNIMVLFVNGGSGTLAITGDSTAIAHWGESLTSSAGEVKSVTLASTTSPCEVSGSATFLGLAASGSITLGTATLTYMGYHKVANEAAAKALITGDNQIALVGWGAYEGGQLALVGKISPATPEPATATLSLLALAGLASRRRRK